MATTAMQQRLNVVVHRGATRGGPPRAAYFDKLYEIFFPNYFEQPLLICYIIAYLLI